MNRCSSNVAAAGLRHSRGPWKRRFVVTVQVRSGGRPSMNQRTNIPLLRSFSNRFKVQSFLNLETHFCWPVAYSAKTPSSDNAGQAAALDIRNRILLVVNGRLRINRQLPMLVPLANSAQQSSCHQSTVNASMRCPSGKYSRNRTTLNVTGRLNSKTTSALVTESSVAQ